MRVLEMCCLFFLPITDFGEMSYARQVSMLVNRCENLLRNISLPDSFESAACL